MRKDLKLVESFSELRPGTPVIIQCKNGACGSMHEGMILDYFEPGTYGAITIDQGVELVPMPPCRRAMSRFVIIPEDVAHKLVWIRLDPGAMNERRAAKSSPRENIR